MSILVIAEHDNSSLKPATLNAVTAAVAISGEIRVLVAGQGCQQVAAAAAQITGVAQVLVKYLTLWKCSPPTPLCVQSMQGMH
jgi:electron transfer flavoprotein alpha subunit